MKHVHPLSVIRVFVSSLIILSMLSFSIGQPLLVRGVLVVEYPADQFRDKTSLDIVMFIDNSTRLDDSTESTDAQISFAIGNNNILNNNGSVAKSWPLIIYSKDNQPEYSSISALGLSSGVVATNAHYLHTCTFTQAGEIKCWRIEKKTGQNKDNISRISTYTYDALGRPEAGVNSLLKDDNNQVLYYGALDRIAESGIISGSSYFPTNTFFSKNTITRQQAILMLSRSFANKDTIPVTQPGGPPSRESAPATPLTIPTAPIGIPVEPLTSREYDVLVCIVQGKSNKEIAQKLKIAQKTVEVYVYRLTRKFGVPTRVGLAVVAVMFGLVDVKYEDLQPVRINQL